MIDKRHLCCKFGIYLPDDPGVRNLPHNGGDVGLISFWELRSHTPQLLNPHGTTRDMLEGPEEINKLFFKKEGGEWQSLFE